MINTTVVIQKFDLVISSKFSSEILEILDAVVSRGDKIETLGLKCISGHIPIGLHECFDYGLVTSQNIDSIIGIGDKNQPTELGLNVYAYWKSRRWFWITNSPQSFAIPISIFSVLISFLVSFRKEIFELI